MNTLSHLLKNELIRLLQNIKSPEWATAEIVFQFPPTHNKGFKTLPSFKDITGNKVRLIPQIDESFTNAICNFIVDFNKDRSINEIVFTANNQELEGGKIDVRFNSQIVTTFEENLPNHLKGKTTAWFLAPKAT